MPVLPLSIQQMMGNPFLPGDPFTTPIPPVRKAVAPEGQGPLTAQEIQEAQDLGIIPKATPAPIPPAIQSGLDAANGGQISAPQAPSAGTFLVPRPVIGRRVAKTGPDYVPRVQLTPDSAPPSPLTLTLQARREALNKELEKTTQTPDYTALSKQMQDRSRMGNDDMYAAALAGLGPEATRGFQEPLLKASMAARAPMKIEGGVVDENGRVMLDPGFQAAKKADMLRNRLAQLDALEARAYSDQDRNAIAHERNMVMMEMSALRAQFNNYQNQSQTFGYDPVTGNRVIEDRMGHQYMEDQAGNRTPYHGQAIQKAPFERNVSGSQQLQGLVTRIGELQRITKENPQAFGFGASLIAKAPGILESRMMSKYLTPEQMAARNYVQKQAANDIHEIYGAALTAGESNRAAAWAPGPDDSFETTMSKLEAALNWAQSKLGAQGAAVNTAAQNRISGSGAPATPGAIPRGWSVKVK